MIKVEHVETLEEAVVIGHSILKHYSKYGRQCVIIIEKTGFGTYHVLTGVTYIPHTKKQLLDILPGVAV